MPVLEICVDSAASLDAAWRGGADRIELCAALGLGGLTPSAGLMAIAAECPVPCHAMIRPRPGGFDYDEAEERQMAADIDAAAAAGVAGVVFGATAAGQLDAALLARLLAQAEAAGAARGRRLATTLHRAIDTIDDPVAGVDLVIALGFDRVLTSGAAPIAPDGGAMLRAMIDRAGDAITIAAGSGITAATVADIIALGIDDVHASCADWLIDDAAALGALGFAARWPSTTLAHVRALRAAIDRPPPAK
jgi:copper homeostasis protein